MPGKESVYQGRAGTGAAWIGPQYSFDPAQFAKYAIQLKGAQKAADQKAKQKQMDDFYRNLSIKKGAVLESDIPVIDSFENDFYNWKADTVSNLAGGQGMTSQDIKDGYKYKQQFQQFNDNSVIHAKGLNSYLQTIKGGSKDLDTEAMMNNAATYANPSMFLDNEDVKNTWEPIYQTVLEDPVYGRDPEKAKIIANNLWRNEHGQDYIVEPIYKDTKLLEHWKQNGIPLIAENKKYVGKRTADGTEITEEYLAKLPYDTVVKVDNGDGTFSDVNLVGSRHVANDFYDTDPAIKKSADNLFNKQNDEVKEDYTNRFGEDAAKEYYSDLVSPYGVETSSKEITKAPLPKATNKYSYGGNEYESPWNIRPFTDKTNLEFDTDPTKRVGGVASINGFTIVDDKGKPLTLQGVRPTTIFRQSNGSQVKIPNGYTMDITDARVEQVATTKGLTWDKMKQAKTYDGKNVYDEFMKKFGDRYLEEGAVGVGDISNITLTDDIATWLSDNGMGEFIEDKPYVTGQIDYYIPSTDPKKAGQEERQHQSDAIIPLDNYMSQTLDAVLELPIVPMLQTKFKPRNWSKGYKSGTNNDVTPKNDPIKDMKDKAKNTDQGDQKKDSNGDVVWD